MDRSIVDPSGGPGGFQEAHPVRDFVVGAESTSDTLLVELGVAAKLAEPGSAQHDLLTHCVMLVRQLRNDASTLTDGWTH